MSNDRETRTSGPKVAVYVAGLAIAMSMGWCGALATLDRGEKTATAPPKPSDSENAPVVTQVAPVPASDTAQTPAQITPEVTQAPPPDPAPPPPVQHPPAIARKAHAPKPAARPVPRVAATPPRPHPVCTDERACDTTDLQRCLRHDGAGCASVGSYYELERADPFNAITWYRKGCDLGDAASCSAFDRVKDARPRTGPLPLDPLASSMPVIGFDTERSDEKEGKEGKSPMTLSSR